MRCSLMRCNRCNDCKRRFRTGGKDTQKSFWSWSHCVFLRRFVSGVPLTERVLFHFNFLFVAVVLPLLPPVVWLLFRCRVIFCTAVAVRHCFRFFVFCGRNKTIFFLLLCLPQKMRDLSPHAVAGTHKVRSAAVARFSTSLADFQFIFFAADTTNRI